MSDALPHLIMHLSKVRDKTFKDEFNIFSSEYNIKRKRLLRKEVDYNTLIK